LGIVVGDCWNNAPMESFFYTLKTELPVPASWVSGQSDRGRPVALDLPDTSTVAGVSEAQQAILQAVGSGDLLPGEGTALARIVEARRKALETVELEQHITALEQSHVKT